MIKKIFASEFLNVGGIISPLNAWLFIRGLRTLEIRLERISSSTLKIVNHLASHPKIEKMIYPFHPSFPQYELAREQMKQGGGLFSVVLKANSVSQIETFCNALKRFLMAVSWGGHESLVFPVAATLKKGAYDPQTPGHNLVRFYIGLEDPEVLIEDIENALRLI
jgi:cystathionine beta-lyase/cystathionine gamma-synthase